MKALLYHDRRTVTMEEIPIPEIQNDEVLVETKFCGICSSDILDWYREPKAPMFFGHEAVGIVKRVGSEVVGFSVGDSVFVHHHVPCMVCRYCARGNYSMCEVFKSSNLDPGGFSEYIRVPEENVRKGLLKLPENLPLWEGTFIEPLACALQAVKRSSLRVGDRVALFGAGFNGILLLIVARIFGAESVIVFEPNSYRAEVARHLGASAVFDPQKFGDMQTIPKAEVVFVTPPFANVIEKALFVAEQGGTVLLYAPSPPGEYLNLDIFNFYFSQLTLRTSYSASPLETRQALHLLETYLPTFAQIPVVKYPFTRFQEAFVALRGNPEILKVILDFTSS